MEQGNLYTGGPAFFRCHYVIAGHFRFPKCLPVNGNHDTLLGKWKPLWMIATTGVLCYTGHTIAVKMLLFT